jgi:Domain of unknown function (DUF4476)
MKNIFTILSFVFFSTNLFAFDTKLSVTSMYNDNIKIELDGNIYSLNKYSNDLDLDNLNIGSHRLVIYKQQTRRRSPWGGNSNNVEIIYQGNIVVKNRYQTDVIVTRFGKVYIDEEFAQNTSNGYPNGNSNYQAMEQNSFNNLKQLVSKEAFDKNKLSAINLAADYNYFSTNQVKDLLQFFSFDSGKLDVAKLLLTKVVDRQNYFLLTDQFIFSNTKNEFKEYLQSH